MTGDTKEHHPSVTTENTKEKEERTNKVPLYQTRTANLNDNFGAIHRK